jgi:hypothetical protein
MKQEKYLELLPYERLIDAGLKAISDLNASMVRLEFPNDGKQLQQIICNVLQIPQVYDSDQTLVVEQIEPSQKGQDNNVVAIYVLNLFKDH